MTHKKGLRWPYLLTWRRRQHIPPKRRYLRSYTRSRKTTISTFTAAEIGQLSYRLTFIRKGNGALKAGQSFGAQYRMGQQFTVQTLLFENIPCCRTSSACTSMTKKTDAIHKICLQACPRQTPPILFTIFVNTVHKLSVHKNTQHHYTFIKTAVV
jgi:hypothetical protein